VAFGFHRCQPWPKFFSRLRGWYGVGAPKATPTEIVDKLNKEINAGLADPKIKARFADLGGAPGLAADFGKLIAEEIEKWAFGAPTPYQPRSREKNFGVCAAAARDRSIHCRKVIVTSFI
jgi:hypothetical protein